MRGQGIGIGDEWYRTKDDLRKRIRSILHACPFGQELGAADTAFMLEVLERHPDAGQKTGVGVAAIGVAEDRWGGRHFVAHRRDGTSTDFSFEQCLRASTPLQKVKRACRAAVAEDVMAVKQAFFAHEHEATCPVSGELITFAHSHVDHQPPDTFDHIVGAFLAVTGLTVETIALAGEGVDGATGVQFADPGVAAAFRAFHRERAVLRVVSPRANLSDIKRQRTTPASGPEKDW